MRCRKFVRVFVGLAVLVCAVGAAVSVAGAITPPYPYAGVPNSDIHTDWTGNEAGPHWALVDDQDGGHPWNDKVSTSTAGAYEEYGVTNAGGHPDGSPFQAMSVRVLVNKTGSGSGAPTLTLSVWLDNRQTWFTKTIAITGAYQQVEWQGTFTIADADSRNNRVRMTFDKPAGSDWGCWVDEVIVKFGPP